MLSLPTYVNHRHIGYLLQRHSRAAHFSIEWRLYQGRAHIELGIAHPKIHKRWARHIHIWVYIPCLESTTAKYRGRRYARH